MEPTPQAVKPEDVSVAANIVVLKSGQVIFNLPQDAVQALGLLQLGIYQVHKTMDAIAAENQTRIVKPRLLS